MNSGLKSKTIERPWYIPRKPGEIEPYPWLHPSAVNQLERILTPDMRVLEHGAGGSTLWFAERVSEVSTVEHNPEWAAKVRELAPGNVTVFIRDDDGWLTDGDLRMITFPFDLAFIDGKLEERGYWLERVHMVVKPGGWLVLDNANHPEYAKERHALHERFKLGPRFDNNIHISKFFVTEFWVMKS